MFLDILSYREAAMARQAKLHAAGASSISQNTKPVKAKPTQPQSSTAGIQGGLVSVCTAQCKYSVSLNLYEHIATQLVHCFP
jgi:hypothetical protein